MSLKYFEERGLLTLFADDNSHCPSTIYDATNPGFFSIPNSNLYTATADEICADYLNKCNLIIYFFSKAGLAKIWGRNESGIRSEMIFIRSWATTQGKNARFLPVLTECYKADCVSNNRDPYILPDILRCENVKLSNYSISVPSDPTLDLNSALTILNSLEQALGRLGVLVTKTLGITWKMQFLESLKTAEYITKQTDSTPLSEPAKTIVVDKNIYKALNSLIESGLFLFEINDIKNSLINFGIKNEGLDAAIILTLQTGLIKNLNIDEKLFYIPNEYKAEVINEA